MVKVRSFALGAGAEVALETRKKATIFDSAAACSCRLSAVAAAFSTSAAFCSVTGSIWVMVWLIYPIPVLCWWLAAVTSATRPVTQRTLATTSSIVELA